MSFALLMGLLLGARHALEPDHLTAVTVLAAESRTSRSGLWLGALWGLGHTAALIAFAGVLSALSLAVPRTLENALELAVGAMLVVLGGRAVYRALRLGREGQTAPHEHAHALQRHAGPAEHVHLGSRTFALRPLLVGLVHGLAGTGALTALAVSSMPSGPSRFAFVTLFGLGSVLGMATLSGLVGLPLARLARGPRTRRALLAVAGLGSVVLGGGWAAERIVVLAAS